MTQLTINNKIDSVKFSNNDDNDRDTIEDTECNNIVLAQSGKAFPQDPSSTKTVLSCETKTYTQRYSTANTRKR